MNPASVVPVSGRHQVETTANWVALYTLRGFRWYTTTWYAANAGEILRTAVVGLIN